MSEPAVLALLNSDGKVSAPLADPPGVVTRLHELRFRVVARTPYEHLFTELGTVETAERALAEGCDALFIDTVGDYGLDGIRMLTSVPVVGAGEEGIRAAAAVGPFSVVTVWPASMRYLYDERLAASPGGERCGGVHHLSAEDELDRVGRSDGVKARMLRSEGDLLDQLVDLCRRAVDDDHTDAVLLGCTCMAPVAGALADRLPFPVVDPSRVGLAVAHAAALSSVSSRPHSVPDEVRHAGLASSVVDAYLGAQDSEAVALDDCEVCLVAGAAGS